MVRTGPSERDPAVAALPMREGLAALARSRLTESSWREPILLSEAPAGYGKSTLAQQILRSTPRGTRAIALSLLQRAGTDGSISV